MHIRGMQLETTEATQQAAEVLDAELAAERRRKNSDKQLETKQKVDRLEAS